MARTRWTRFGRGQALLAALAVAASTVVAPSAGGAAPPPPGIDPFYRYSGSTPLSALAPGTVLKTRSVPYHIAGLALPLTVTQLLYRTTGATGSPTVNVTSVVHAPGRTDPRRAVAYQSFYDSLNPDDEPSYAFAGGTNPGGVIANVETALFAPLLLSGYSIVVADTQGQQADFAAGPEYGRTTLDSIRAASRSSATGLTPTTRVGLIGYSGGAIATGWAAALAPTYAPDVDRRLVGAAEGGVLVEPAHNLHYIEGSQVWAGVLAMALVGVARAYRIDLTPYANDYGKQLLAKLQKASITQVLGMYPGLTWAKIAKPQYASPESVPAYVHAANQLNLGSVRAPTVPMFIGQGANGALEGTSGSKPGIGRGDGVMIAGDVRTLARKYCAAGTRVTYRQYDLLTHFSTVPVWLPAALAWLQARFAGTPAPQNCASIAPGNPLTPVR